MQAKHVNLISFRQRERYLRIINHTSMWARTYRGVLSLPSRLLIEDSDSRMKHLLCYI